MNYQIKQFSGLNEIIGNGVALVDDEKPLKIQYLDLVYVLSYVKDEGAPPSVRTNIKDAECFIELVNFSETEGQGVTEPMEIGIHGGRKLLIAFWNEPLTSEADRKLTWQLLLESNN